MFQLQNLQTDSILEGAWHEKNTCLMRNLLDTSSHLSHLKAMAKLSRQVATWAGDSSEGVYIPEIWRMDSPIWRIGWRYLYIYVKFQTAVSSLNQHSSRAMPSVVIF